MICSLFDITDPFPVDWLIHYHVVTGTDAVGIRLSILADLFSIADDHCVESSPQSRVSYRFSWFAEAQQSYL